MAQPLHPIHGPSLATCFTSPDRHILETYHTNQELPCVPFFHLQIASTLATFWSREAINDLSVQLKVALINELNPNVKSGSSSPKQSPSTQSSYSLQVSNRCIDRQPREVKLEKEEKL